MRIPAARVVLATLLAALAACAGQQPPQVELDASSAAGGSQQLPLTVAASPGGQPSSEPSVEPAQQVAYGASVTLLGRVAALSQHHADAAGSSIVNATLTGLPANYSEADVVCVFPPYDTIKGLEGAALQRSGSTDFTTQQDLLDQYLQLVLSQPRSNASLAFSPSLACKILDKCPKDGAYNFTMLCAVPAGGQDVVPSALALQGSDDDSQGSLYTVSRGSTMMRMQRIAFDSMSPRLGPSAGGTNLAIQGQGLQAGVQCVWLNGTAQPVQRLSANVTHVSEASARCGTPAWPLQGAAGLPVVMQLVWPDGSSLEMGKFSYYPTPWISELAAAAIPRHGSANVTALLGSSFASMPNAMAAALQPRLEIQAPGADATGLVLPANWTQDGTGLTAATPGDSQPLAQGSYLVLATLNDQDFSGGFKGTDVVLEVEGPLVSMAVAYRPLTAGQATANVTLALSTPPAAPVTATLALEQRTAAGVSQLSLPGEALSSQQVYWEAGTNNTQNISISLPQGDSFADRALLVTLASASNADVDESRASTIVSAAPQEDLRLTFEAATNQVVYPGANASIPVNVTAGRIPVPGAVDYLIEPQTLVAAPFLPAVNGSLTGTLRWDPANASALAIPVPIDWSQVLMEAVYRLGCILEDAWNANVTDHRWQPALHIFGVDQGTCPPGTYLKAAPGSSNGSTVAALSPAAELAAGPGAEDAYLRDLHLLAPGGAAIELSTQFQPATTVYGAMVTEDVTNATLCVDPAMGGASVSVFNGTEDLLRPVTPAGAAAAATFSASFLGRRLAGLLGARAGACGEGQAAYVLPFALGQNDFDVFIRSNASTAAAQGGEQSYGEADAAARADGNSTVRYTLAIVRLADPQHAQLASLNATLPDGSELEVCGPAAAAAAAAAPVPAPEPALEEAGGGDDAGSPAPEDDGACTPNQVEGLNVTADVQYLSLQPQLRYPSVQGVRVEVNGQVLSQGGNLGADRITDTTSELQVRTNPGFLPDAIIVGLQPGLPLQVPIVIIAEDGVTSLRYYVAVTREAAAPGMPAPAPELGAAQPPLGAMLSQLSAQAGVQHLSVAAPAAGNSSAPAAASAAGESQSASAAAQALSEPVPKGWPVPPAQDPHCGACVGGWASTEANASFCTMCGPGSYAASAFSPNCSSCPAGTYSSSWGSTHCRHCVTGTYGPSEGGQLCVMCPTNFTTLADGSTDCDTPVGPGTDLSTRYAVIVSFGVLLNGTALDEVAQRVGVNASSEAVLDTLVKSDTASAFNISLGDVHVTGVEQVSRRVLYVNVSASLPVDVPPGASDEDVRAAIAVQSIAADDPIKMLVQDPDKFFGRTTKALGATAESDGHGAQRTLSSPLRRRRLALPWPAILGIILGGLVVAGLTGAVFARRRTRRAYQAVTARLGALRMPTLRRWGLVERAGSGSSQGSVATEPGAASGAPGGARVRSSRPESRMMRGPHSDAVADV